jgi:carbonic anhydrase
MQKLVEGVHHFQNIGFRQYQDLFNQLKDGQHPEACFITCADSRIVPHLITSSQPGQLFIVRNVGNIVPCYGTSNNGEMAAVEYAILALGIEHIIICGHTCCGAMRQLVEPAAPATSTLQGWLRHADATAEIINTHYQHLDGGARVNAAAEENVLVQLEHLRTLPAVASRLSTGKVRLHAWMYKFETGEVFAYDSEVGQYVRLGDSPAAAGNGQAEQGNGVGRKRQAAEPARSR